MPTPGYRDEVIRRLHGVVRVLAPVTKPLPFLASASLTALKEKRGSHRPWGKLCDVSRESPRWKRHPRTSPYLQPIELGFGSKVVVKRFVHTVAVGSPQR